MDPFGLWSRIGTREKRGRAMGSLVMAFRYIRIVLSTILHTLGVLLCVPGMLVLKAARRVWTFPPSCPECEEEEAETDGAFDEPALILMHPGGGRKRRRRGRVELA
jgi:hypothetical protein